MNILKEILEEINQAKIDSSKDGIRTGDYRIGLTKAEQIINSKLQGQNLPLNSVSQQRELLNAFQEYYQTGDYNDEYSFDENINRFLKAFNCC